MKLLSRYSSNDVHVVTYMVILFTPLDAIYKRKRINGNEMIFSKEE
jgi:hypothetical protein